MVSAVPPALVSFTFFAVLVVPAAWPAKLKLLGFRLTAKGAGTLLGPPQPAGPEGA